MKRPLARWITAAGVMVGLLGVTAAVAGATRFSAWTEPVNLGVAVNSPQADNCAFEAKSGLSLYFSSNRPGGSGGFDLYVSQRADSGDPWGSAQNLGPAVNSASDDACPVIVPSGHELIFYSNRPGGAGDRDLYIARRHDKRDDLDWGTPQNLSTVNTSFAEAFPTVFEDEDNTLTLYFGSDRLAGGGLPALDVYVSTRANDDIAFGAANYVPELSSASGESLLSVRRDGLEIFVASSRPGTLGGVGTDLWVASRNDTDDSWGSPVNSGPALATVGGGSLNTTAGESGGAYSRDGTVIYVTSTRLPSQGGIDIWQATRDNLKMESTNP